MSRDARLVALALLTLPVAALADDAVRVLSLPPGCLEGGTGNINLVSVLLDHSARSPGTATVESSGSSALAAGGRWLFPEGNLADVDVPRAFLQGLAKGAAKAEVLDEALPVLVSPWEVNFQWPRKGRADVLRAIEKETGEQGSYPDTERRTGRLLRYAAPGGAAVLALELDAPAAPDPDVMRWEPVFVVRTRIEAGGGRTDLVSLARTMRRGPRVKAELDRLRAAGPEGRVLVVQPGGAVDGSTAEQHEYCADAFARTRPDAAVPDDGDLGLGVEALVGLAKAHALPYVAANLVDARPGAKDPRPFPQSITREVGGLTVLLAGVVGTDRLGRLPPAVAAQWRIEDPAEALARVVRDATDQLGKKPDLVVALVAAGAGDRARVLEVSGVDVALGDASRNDLLPGREAIAFEPGAREKARFPRVLAAIRGSPYAIEDVTARFVAAPERAHLASLEHAGLAVVGDGSRDDALEAALRALEEPELVRNARALLPDVAPLLDRHPELAPLVWGEHLPYRRGFRRYEKPLPGRWSDPLWDRFVMNLVRRDTGADVVVSRNFPRHSDMVGPIARNVVQDWLEGRDLLRIVELTGDELRALAARLQAQEKRDNPAERLLFSVGLDLEHGLVGGRPITPRDRFRMATTDFVLGAVEVADVFGKAAPETRFETRDGRLVPSSAGAEVPVRDLVERALEAWAGPDGAFAAAHEADLEAMLLDDPARLVPRWALVLDELSLQGARYGNSANVGTFAATRETRATTPDNTSLRHRGNLALVYDGPTLAWETRLKTMLDRVVLHVPGVPPQEGNDDIVAFTELRLNAVRVSMGAAAARLVPFVQTAFDGEFTATPNPAEPGTTFPHQKLWRNSAGVVLYPGAYVTEARLGLLHQVDFSAATRRDFGALAGLKLALPLVGPAMLTSDLDVRYLVPDADDTPTDLGLVVASVTKVVVPVSAGFAVFLVADARGFAGKLPENRDLAGSWILGGGVDFSTLFRL